MHYSLNVTILEQNPMNLVEFLKKKTLKLFFNTDLQWLGLGTEMKTVSFQWDTA